MPRKRPDLRPRVKDTFAASVHVAQSTKTKSRKGTMVAKTKNGGLWLPPISSVESAKMVILVDVDWYEQLKEFLEYIRENLPFGADEVIIGSVVHGDEFLAYTNNPLRVLIVGMHAAMSSNGDYALAYTPNSGFCLNTRCLLYSTAKFIFVATCNYGLLPIQTDSFVTRL